VPARGDCTLPDGWTTYRVRSGNTLFAIAQSVGSTIGELRDANCLANIDNIYAGDLLFVPREPITPVRTIIPLTPNGTPQVAAPRGAVGCTVPGVRISQPFSGQSLTGMFTVAGTASIDNFQYYRLEVRPDASDVYNFYSRSEAPVTGGVLGEINSDLFENGLHWVRLTVVDNTGNYPQPCAIPVTFR
jgi:LysM repeat protein